MLDDSALPRSEDSPLVDRTVRAGTFTVLLRLITILSQIVITIVIVRQLGADAYGRYSVAMIALSLCVLLMLAGGDNALPRFIPEYVALKDPGSARRLFLHLLAVTLSLWVAITLGYVLWGRALIADLYGPVVAWTLLVGLLIAPATLIQSLAYQALTSLFRVGTQVWAALLGTAVTFVAIFSFPRTPSGVVLALGTGAVVAGAVLVWQLALIWRSVPPAVGGGHRGRTMRYALSFLLGGLLNLIVYRQSETLVLGAFASSQAVATYNVGYALPQRVLEFLPAVLLSIGVVSVSEAFTKDKSLLAPQVTAFYRALFIFVAPISIGGAALGGALTMVLFGPQFHEAGVVAQYFFLIFALVFLTTPYALVLRAWERVWTGVGLYAIQAVINVGMDLLLIPRFGVRGAVAAVTVTVVASTAMNFAVFSRIDRSVSVPWGSIGRSFGAALPLALLAPFAAHADRPLTLGALLALAFMVWLAAARVLHVFGPTERLLIERLPIPSKLRRATVRVLGA